MDGNNISSLFEVWNNALQTGDPNKVAELYEPNVRTFGDIAINSGVYTFTFKDGSSVQARFSYVYRWNGQDWRIIEHHSSAMPE